MSTKDRARNKLLNSMRKTKAVINEQTDSKQAHAQTYAPPEAQKPAPQKPSEKPSPKAARKAAPAQKETPLAPIASTRPEMAADPYQSQWQSRGRIWPD